jgi:hypothetical protein
MKSKLLNLIIISLVAANMFLTVTDVSAMSQWFADSVKGVSEIRPSGSNDYAFGSTSRSPAVYRISVYVYGQTWCGGYWHATGHNSSDRTYRSYVEHQALAGTTDFCPDSQTWQNRSVVSHYAQISTVTQYKYYGVTEQWSDVRFNQ